MTLLQRDPVEQMLGKDVQSMDVHDLLVYSQEKFKARFGYALVIEGYPENGVLRRLVRLYKTDAGLMIKWVFEKHDGLWKTRDKTNKFSVMWFQTRFKWWTDQMYAEVQAEKTRLEALESGETRPSGFGTVEGFI